MRPARKLVSSVAIHQNTFLMLQRIDERAVPPLGRREEEGTRNRSTLSNILVECGLILF